MVCVSSASILWKIPLPFIITIGSGVQSVPRSQVHMAGCLPPATLQVVHVRFGGSSPKVQVPLPCSELASDQYASNLTGKSWRHPSAWSFRMGCPDWAFSIIYQCILLRCIKEYTESWCFQIEQISSVLFEHLHLAPVCHAYTSCETHALPFCILLGFIKGFW